MKQILGMTLLVALLIITVFALTNTSKPKPADIGVISGQTRIDL